MKQKRPLHLERLEARETPDVSLGQAVAWSAPPSPSPALLGVGPSIPAPVSPALAETPAIGLDLVRGLHGDQPSAPDHLRAIETLFVGRDELAPFLAEGAQQQAQVEPAPGPVADAGEGWRFLWNYTNKAIRTEETRYGKLADHDDLIQQTFVEWRTGVGPQDDALGKLLQSDSPERLVLRNAVRRVLDHARYVQTRDNRMLALIDQAAPSQPAEQDWLDLQIDLDLGVGGLEPQERDVFAMRARGMTFQEIGDSLSMARQRAFEIFSDAMDKLQDAYADAEAVSLA
ncbi:MAG: hypothetical protein C5B58_02365 [Acidobacteria bacterium]|nr:MAG: hypothetical protein C5B58_02365 [Acidobacteriota bacterium]